MKVTKVIYLRRDEDQTTEKEITDYLYLHDELEECFKPDNWVAIKSVEIDIPDSLINDIINTNTETDIAGKIAKHKAEIIKLQDFRNRGK